MCSTLYSEMLLIVNPETGGGEVAWFSKLQNHPSKVATEPHQIAQTDALGQTELYQVRWRCQANLGQAAT